MWRALLLALALLAPVAAAQQSEHFGPYELHYSVVNTTFLEPQVAAAYGITRGKDKAILNLSLREQVGSDSEARSMLLKGRSWDLMQRGGALEFQEIREGPAIYYIAEFEFLDREWRHFEVDFRPAGTERSYTFKFRHQLFRD